MKRAVTSATPIVVRLIFAGAFSCLGAIGCGSSAEDSAACRQLESALCSTDQSCDARSPCSFKCESLDPPRDEVVLQTCADAYAAIPLPDKTQEPVAHAGACSMRSLKAVECTTLFLPE